MWTEHSQRSNKGLKASIYDKRSSFLNLFIDPALQNQPCWSNRVKTGRTFAHMVIEQENKAGLEMFQRKRSLGEFAAIGVSLKNCNGLQICGFFFKPTLFLIWCKLKRLTHPGLCSSEALTLPHSLYFAFIYAANNHIWNHVFKDNVLNSHGLSGSLWIWCVTIFAFISIPPNISKQWICYARKVPHWLSSSL